MPQQWGLGSTDIDATPLVMAAVSWREQLMVTSVLYASPRVKIFCNCIFVMLF